MHAHTIVKHIQMHLLAIASRLSICALYGSSLLSLAERANRTQCALSRAASNRAEASWSCLTCLLVCYAARTEKSQGARLACHMVGAFWAEVAF